MGSISTNSIFTILLLICFFPNTNSTLYGYRQDLENSTQPEAFQGLLAAFGLQIRDGQGVPGYLSIAEDAEEPLDTDLLHSLFESTDKLTYPQENKKSQYASSPSYACGAVKPPPIIKRKYWLPDHGWVIPADSDPKGQPSHFNVQKIRTPQEVSHQSRSKIIQTLYNKVCASGIAEVIKECKRNKDVFDNLLNVFALVKRGHCEFEDKVLNVQNAGYQGAIIYDPDHDGVIIMHGERRYDISIPSMMVGKGTAEQLINHYLYKPSETDDEIQNFVLMVSDDDSIINYLLPFTLIVAVCLITMMVFSILRVIRQWRAHRKARLTKRKLKKLPKKKYCKETDTEWETCAICIEDYEEGDMLRILPCNHAYHMDCIDPWLTRSRRNCPLCKRSVLSDEESMDNGNGTSEFSVSTSETSENSGEEVVNDETPLLDDQIEEARGLVNSGSLSLDEQHSASIRGGNMVVRLLRSVRRFSTRNLNRSENLSDYGSDDEEPLIVRTTLRRQGAIRRANISPTSSNPGFIESSESIDQSSEENQASEDELPLTSDDNNSSITSSSELV